MGDVTELLPCPFCGVEPEILNGMISHPPAPHREGACVLAGLGISLIHSKWGTSQLEAWNTRARPDLPGGVGELKQWLLGLAQHYEDRHNFDQRNVARKIATALETLAVENAEYRRIIFGGADSLPETSTDLQKQIAKHHEKREAIAKVICLSLAGDKHPTPVPDSLMPNRWPHQKKLWLKVADDILSLCPTVQSDRLSKAARLILGELMNAEEHDAWEAAQDVMDKGGMVNAADVVIAALRSLAGEDR